MLHNSVIRWDFRVYDLLQNELEIFAGIEVAKAYNSKQRPPLATSHKA